MRTARAVLSLAALLAAAATAAFVLSRTKAGPGASEYKPVVRGSALDRWTPSWTGGTSGAPEARLPDKWIVIGWDGASWDIALPLVDAGRLPHLARLMREGAYGSMLSFTDAPSPALWTTVATGVSPRRHGILHFVKPGGGTTPASSGRAGRRRGELFSNADRKVKALWNVASEHGRSVAVVGYHNTFPAEKVRGAMVSNYLVRQNRWSLGLEPPPASEPRAHLVYPPAKAAALASLTVREDRIDLATARRFADVDQATFETLMERYRADPTEDKRWAFLLRAYAYDEFHGRAASLLQRDIRPELLLAHFQAPDWAGHNFLYFHAPALYERLPGAEGLRRRLAPEARRYRRSVAAFYEFADEWLGRLLEGREPTTAVMVVSDHGMGPEATAAHNGGHNDAPAGMIVISGPGVKRDHKLKAATLYDILPTLVASLGLPLAEDLEGRVLEEAFIPAALASRARQHVASYGQGGRYLPQVQLEAEMRDEIEEQLRGLGYVR